MCRAEVLRRLYASEHLLESRAANYQSPTNLATPRPLAKKIPPNSSRHAGASSRRGARTVIQTQAGLYALSPSSFHPSCFIQTPAVRRAPPLRLDDPSTCRPRKSVSEFYVQRRRHHHAGTRSCTDIQHSANIVGLGPSRARRSDSHASCGAGAGRCSLEARKKSF